MEHALTDDQIFYDRIHDVVLKNLKTPKKLKEDIRTTCEKIAKERGVDRSLPILSYLYVCITKDDPEGKRVFYEIIFDGLDDPFYQARLVLYFEGLADMVELDRSTGRKVSFTLLGDEDIKTVYEYRWVKKIQLCASADAPYIIVGETGTSKERLARAMHKMSPRRNKPFVEVNCAAIPENLFESELFGYKRGAFTGATKDKKGLVEQAEGGTLFLDELGKMPKGLQAKILRVIEDKEVRGVGAKTGIKVDVRFLAAVQPRDIEKNLTTMERAILSDLIYRLGYPHVLELPNLKTRLSWSGATILWNSLKQAAKALDIEGDFSVTPAAEQALINHEPYEGNFRELQNILRGAILNARMRGTYEIDSVDLDILFVGPLTAALKGVTESKGLLGFDTIDQVTVRDVETNKAPKRLRDLFTYADDVRREIVEAEIRKVKASGKSIKEMLQGEGVTTSGYQNFCKKVRGITKKNLKDV